MRPVPRTPVLSRLLLALCVAAAGAAAARAQTMSIEDYEPKSTLIVPERKVTRAKYPFIDVHNHQNAGMSPEDLDRLVKDMDALNMAVMVNLSGRGFRSSGDHLEKSIENIRSRYPNRFILFTNIDFADIDKNEQCSKRNAASEPGCIHDNV